MKVGLCSREQGGSEAREPKTQRPISPRDAETFTFLPFFLGKGSVANRLPLRAVWVGSCHINLSVRTDLSKVRGPLEYCSNNFTASNTVLERESTRLLFGYH